jgi:hypothetical protein
LKNWKNGLFCGEGGAAKWQIVGKVRRIGNKIGWILMENTIFGGLGNKITEWTNIWKASNSFYIPWIKPLDWNLHDEWDGTTIELRIE